MPRLVGVTGTNKLLSLLFSTDGSPAFNSGNKSMWPITAFINELAPKIRFGLPIVAGIWCSDSPGVYDPVLQRVRDRDGGVVVWW